MQDALAGVFDDDGDELAGVAGAEPHHLLVDHDPAVGVDAAAGDPSGSGAGGCGAEAARAPFIRAARSAVTGQGQVPASAPPTMACMRCPSSRRVTAVPA